MPKHEFGILPIEPITGEQYVEYEPAKYNCISIDDDYIEPIIEDTRNIPVYWNSVDQLEKGFAYYGITLIPPTSIYAFLSLLKGKEYDSLQNLLKQAVSENKYVIHYGI